MNEKEAWGQAFENGRRQGDKEGYERGLREAAARNVREGVYPDGDTDTPERPRCGSGEYLTNEDGDKNCFCGQCGQALDWEEPEVVRYCEVCGAPSIERYCPNCGTRMDGGTDHD